MIRAWRFYDLLRTAGRANSLTLGRGAITTTFNPTTGKVATTQSPDGVDLSYTWDGPLLTGVSWTGPVTGSVTHGYDNDFRIVSQAVGSTPAVTFTRDDDGLLTQAGELTIERDPQTGFITGTRIGGTSGSGGSGSGGSGGGSGSGGSSGGTSTPCAPMTCTDWSPNTNCGTLPDGCGGTISCGTCTAPEVCGGGGPNVCGTNTPETVNCVYWSNVVGRDLQCGQAPDGMGGTDTCGICEFEEAGGGGFCGGGGIPNECGGCVPYPCWYFGAQCGQITDNCGTALECGGCEPGESCGAGGVPNQCAPGACVPTTCAAEGKNCGSIADGCGSTLDCGTCSAPETCGGSGTANVCGTLPGVQTSRTYSGFGELASATATFGGQAIHSVTYTRDKLGRITQLDETLQGAQLGAVIYTYDGAGRLDTVTRDGQLIADYDYDQNGNRTQVSTGLGVMVTATYDEQDRLLTYGDRSYTYTAGGDLTTRTSPAGTQQYTYDALGNLLSVTLEDNTVVSYIIDGENRRVGRRIGGVFVQGFVYQDALNPVAELDGAGNIVARFIYGDKAHVPAYMEKGGNTYRIISDHLGSVRMVVDVATGTVVQRMDYDEFGVVQGDTAPGFQPFGFAGGLYDAQTGLVRFGARDYDAEIGRWTSKDPIGFNGGDLGLYLYAAQDPVNFLDPDGQKIEFASIAAFVALHKQLFSIWKTATGKPILDAMWRSEKTFTIRLTTGSEESNPLEQNLNNLKPLSCYINPTSIVNIKTDKGWKRATLLRKLAHELGHLQYALTGNPLLLKEPVVIHAVENPIVREAEGVSYRRIDHEGIRLDINLRTGKPF